MTSARDSGNQARGMESRVGKILDSAGAPGDGSVLDFDTVYETCVDFAWQTVRRMGVCAADADDVVQEAFIIVHRRLAHFEGRAQIKTWVFKILMNLVRHYWRTHQRKPGDQAADKPAVLETLVAGHDPATTLEKLEALRILDRLLAQLDDDKREVFVLAEFEQMTAVEIAEIVDVSPNTVSSRLRAARHEFERLLARFRAHELRRQP